MGLHRACCCEVAGWSALYIGSVPGYEELIRRTLLFLDEIDSVWGGAILKDGIDFSLIETTDLTLYSTIFIAMVGDLSQNQLDCITAWIVGHPERRLVLLGEWSSTTGGGFYLTNKHLNEVLSELGCYTRFPCSYTLPGNPVDNSKYSTEHFVTDPLLLHYLTAGVWELGRDYVSCLWNWWLAPYAVPLFWVHETESVDWMKGHDPVLVVEEDLVNGSGLYVGGSIVVICDSSFILINDDIPPIDTMVTWGLSWDPDHHRNLQFVYNLLVNFRKVGT